MEKITSNLLPVEAAAKYLSDVLSTGGQSKSEPVDCQRISASIYALAPEGTSSARLLNFPQGGLLALAPRTSDGRVLVERVPNTIPAAASIVWQALMLCEQPALWIHEALLTEEEVVGKKIPYVIIGGNIYLIFDCNLNEQRVGELIRYSVLSWHFLAFVAEGKRQFESVDKLIRSAKLIMAGAYDGESFVYTYAT